MQRRLFLFVGLCSAVLSAGCFEMFQQSSTSPSPTVQLLGGTWSSVTPTSSSLINSCANFKWTVSEQSAAVVSGTFTATCFGNVAVSGSARGTMSGSSISWTATGQSNGGGLSDCSISLAGTAVLEPEQIRIPYTGTTCLGPVSGTEILRK